MKAPENDPRWSPEVRRVYEHDLREMWDRSIAPHVWNAYHAQLDMYLTIARRLAPKAILDVGCAQATLALMLAEEGYAVCANDLRQEFLEYAKSRYDRGNIEFLAGSVYEINPSRKFDLVFANQLIEHVVFPVELLARLRRFLLPGGHLVVTTPNHRYLRNGLPSHSQLGDPHLYEARQFTADGDGHFFAYSKEELVGYFRDAGLRDIRPLFFESPWISGHMKVRYLHRYVPYKVLRAVDWLTAKIPTARAFLCYQLAVTARNPV